MAAAFIETAFGSARAADGLVFGAAETMASQDIPAVTAATSEAAW